MFTKINSITRKHLIALLCKDWHHQYKYEQYMDTYQLNVKPLKS